MRLLHQDFAFELNDEWWAAAGMEQWKPSSSSYRIDRHRFPSTHEVCVGDVAPLRRRLSHGVFNDDLEAGLPARDRVIKILRGFLEDAAMPPVEIVRLPPGETHTYRLTHGAHRFYLSIAAGFTHVPAVTGIVL